jgi:hypothetical protein
MFKTGSLFLAVSALSCLFLLQPISAWAEHPSEHPMGNQNEVTVKTIASAIKKHVDTKSKKDNGYFVVEDKVDNKTLQLKLDRIHMERLSALRGDNYFACVDFTNKDGKSYDIDFFLKDNGDALKVTETIVHKKEGKPRYSWEKQGKFWAKKTVK